MTVYTLPARPDRRAPGARAELRPVPWRQMFWITWRQHRGLLVSVGVTSVAMVAAMLVLGTRIHQDYATLMACHPAASAACQGMSNFFNSKEWRLAEIVRIAVQALPVLLAMFAGPPVLARELEDGTFRYAWTQGMGRVRWTVLKLALLGSVIVIAALVISQLFEWFIGPYQAAQDLTSYGWGHSATVYDWSVFNLTGVSGAAWTLAALCLGAFVGMLVRRILPAMAITVGGYAALALLTAFFLRDHYPVSTYWPMQIFEAGWLLVLSAALTAGTIRLVRRQAA
jgi:hypothetical protein